MGSGEAITLKFDARPYIAGDKINGFVVLDVQRAIEDKIETIRVKVRGSAVAVIPVSTGTTVMYCTDVKPLVRDEVTLWNNQQQDSGILELPFEFTLPTDLPPAFHAHQDHWYKATISYAVQVVAERHGLLRFNRRIGQTFPVLPLATDGQADIATRLSQGWDGDLKTSEKTELVRKGLWGDHAKVEGQLRTPDLETLPIRVPIPITFTVITHTKPLERGKKSRNPFSSHSHSSSSSEDELSFPAPPKTPETIKFLLVQHVKLKAQGIRQTFDVKLGAVGGFGVPSDKALSVPTSPVRTTVLEPSWIPEEGDEKKGRWRQETRFETTLTFNCPPNASLEPGIRMMNELRIEVPFGGIGNGFNWKIPLELNSGIAALGPNSSPPDYWELPPGYFNGDIHHWDDKEKDTDEKL